MQIICIFFFIKTESKFVKTCQDLIIFTSWYYFILCFFKPSFLKKYLQHLIFNAQWVEIISELIFFNHSIWKGSCRILSLYVIIGPWEKLGFHTCFFSRAGMLKICSSILAKCKPFSMIVPDKVVNYGLNRLWLCQGEFFPTFVRTKKLWIRGLL